ncbi:hypothetical protein [Companilactobacillus mishanensis]|uniref:Uncharacterized protein n=1 Tax=Companilactobacillus mishanensis TaxID=2486008 RepID=A0ABW9P7Z7_9LACO|nr:hypothetical protein [Companilactobacillus mishanensis]MQS45286.1 hypothetical protein [Companilactobacillus mishanensis]MQS90024.1 hypothetical protein [Companilactobacillus mishanensis]
MALNSEHSLGRGIADEVSNFATVAKRRELPLVARFRKTRAGRGIDDKVSNFTTVAKRRELPLITRFRKTRG